MQVSPPIDIVWSIPYEFVALAVRQATLENTVSHQARLSRNADAGTGLVGDLSPQPRGHPHVFALNDLDHAFMRPVEITQVARESGGRGARG